MTQQVFKQCSPSTHNVVEIFRRRRYLLCNSPCILVRVWVQVNKRGKIRHHRGQLVSSSSSHPNEQKLIRSRQAKRITYPFPLAWCSIFSLSLRDCTQTQETLKQERHPLTLLTDSIHKIQKKTVFNDKRLKSNLS